MLSHLSVMLAEVYGKSVGETVRQMATDMDQRPADKTSSMKAETIHKMKKWSLLLSALYCPFHFPSWQAPFSAIRVLLSPYNYISATVRIRVRCGRISAMKSCPSPVR